MRTSLRCALVLVLPLVLSLDACGVEAGEPAGAAGSPEVAAPSSATPEPSATPESPLDFLDLAAKAMAEEPAWTFSVKGEEGLTLQGQKNAATYRATVRRAMKPEVLRSEGVITSSKGTRKNEEMYVADGTAHLREGDAPWKHAPVTDPEMRNKVEDPVAVVEEFRTYAKAAGGDVKATDTGGGTVELRVASGKRKLSAVADRAWAKKAKREFDPTAEQLRKAGVAVEDAQLTLSGLDEVLVLDAKTYRIRSHRLDFGFLIPYGGADITFEQHVGEENQGVYAGRIEPPADVR
ncbi:hypothetical protein ACWCRF_15610 [Streptomyces sp. NPDC002405]|uniref:hypothetical protein n=1 Tax=Streptomyces sp. NPDC057596 TaxID=3346178 RepID=UPI00369E6327